MARRRKTQINGYTPDHEMALTRRAAHFLDWAADNHPGIFFQYNDVLKYIMGYKRTPKLDNKEVERMQKNMSRVRVLLGTVYDRGIIRKRGVGVRATFSHNDRASVELPMKAKRFKQAKTSFERTYTAIDQKEVTDPTIKRWMRKDIGGILRALKASDFDLKALPPAGEDR